MKKLFILLFTTMTMLHGANEQCVVKMGYKAKQKEPYILKDNSGLYQELYKKALSDIGCELTIQRKPKKRIINNIKKGKIDFYPGFNFSEKRAKMVYYIKNGLPKGFTAITRIDTKNLKSKDDIKNQKLKNITELGGVDLLKNLNLKTLTISGLTIKKAVAMIQRKRADIFIYNKSQIDFYIKKYKPKNIKIHSNLYKKSESLYLGFSKKSKYIKEIANQNYDKTKPIGLNNFPFVLDKNCIAYKFEESLKKLKDNGYTDKLYLKYFK